jgi:hypothetical protein
MICTPSWDLCTGTLRICSFHFNVGSNTLTEHYLILRRLEQSYVILPGFHVGFSDLLNGVSKEKRWTSAFRLN